MTPHAPTRPMGPVSSGLPIDPDATLSKYLPENASYFYGFPSGNDSDFFNSVPAWVEELVSARTMICGGPSVRPVVFDSVSSNQIRTWLEQISGLELTPADSCVRLPATLSDELAGADRNVAVKSVLKDMIEEGTLFMAQPFLDSDLQSLFHLSPNLSVHYNDKTYLGEYIPEEYLPARHATYTDGPAFHATEEVKVPLPCVVKVTSSSAGDGVRICKTVEEIRAAQESFKTVTEGIFIEEFIEAQENYCIQFGIPHDESKPIEIIGYNHQVITDVGEFLGSVVCPPHIISNPLLYTVFSALTDEILPHVRAAGWYGVGGLDVLISTSGKLYFIDPNFRQTATFGLVSMARRGLIKKKAIGFIGTFTGTEEEFMRVLTLSDPKSSHHKLQMISLSRKGDLYRFNAGLLYENKEELTDTVRMLHDLKVEGKVIELLTAGTSLNV